MSIKCLFCNDDVSFLKSISTPEVKTWESRICFGCIKIINALVAEKYREQGWQITKDALVVNIDYNTEKESA